MTLPLTKEQIEAIQARAEKATPGEWSFSEQIGLPGHCDMAQVFDSTGHSLAVIEPTLCSDGATSDAKFIAHARTDIPALCQQALRAIELEAENKRHDQLRKDLLDLISENDTLVLSLQSELTATRKAMEEERERSDSLANQLQDYREGRLP